MNTNFKVIGLTRFGIKSKSTALEAYALTTSWPLERLKEKYNHFTARPTGLLNEYIIVNIKHFL